LCIVLALGVATSRLGAEDPLPDVKRLESSPVLRHLKPNPVPATLTGPGASTVSQMYLPEGFRAELIAAEPDIQQPVAFAFDERGRIWVAEAYSYPQKQPAGKGLDKIVILEDADGDGRFESRKVFAEGLNLVSGFELGYGGVWVGAAPELLFIPDRNHDDIPDSAPEVLLDGFGFQDTHECLNSFLWGPDGWLYGNQGVFNESHIGRPGSALSGRVTLRAGVWRYHPTRHEFEVFADGGSNQWGLDYDERGQLFMTHCRSYWGRGCTTHVLQGGQFWNQANANYAPFIIADPPADFPSFRNFLLASARYDHGAGGAGKPGSDAIYGGHSHVGTMIYLGDNWPEEYRGHLFTHNLHGHQINHQVNRPLGSGYDTVHAGLDQFFCSDPFYVAVDLQYGPDGAVYTIDWYDRQHCHNPNTERWDRTNGRIYRIEWDKTYRPRKVDLGRMNDSELAALLTHRNEWFVRMARRVLSERARTGGGVATAALGMIRGQAGQNAEPARRLAGLWTLHGMDQLTPEDLQRALRDVDPHVRGWAVQLATDNRSKPSPLAAQFGGMAATEVSPVVRRYLASAAQRVPGDVAWEIIEALARRTDDLEDRNIPLLLWDALAQRMPADVPRAFALAEKTPVAVLADYVHWYAGTMDGDALRRAIQGVAGSQGDTTRRRLAGLALALNPRGTVRMPEGWKELAAKLYTHADPRVRRLAERVASVFGDDSMFPRLRTALVDATADPETRKHAFTVLSRGPDRGSLPTFLKLIDDAGFRLQVVRLLARFDSPEVSESLIARFGSFNPAEKSAALGALTSRVPFAIALLDAVGGGRIPRDQVTSLQVRQLSQLGNAEVDRRVAANWGRIKQSSAEKQAQIARLEKIYNEAPLWAFDGRAGKEHFLKVCATCHRIGNDGVRLGPELTGAGRNGIRYFLENIIDPNAVIGSDFQMTVLETKGGDVLSGLLVSETAGAVTLRTTADQVVVPKGDITRRSTSENSLMPEGLLDTLTQREQIELLKFLTSQ
jgi:putative membrane-bound dehydrogenase-like protein